MLKEVMSIGQHLEGKIGDLVQKYQILSYAPLSYPLSVKKRYLLSRPD